MEKKEVPLFCAEDIPAYVNMLGKELIIKTQADSIIFPVNGKKLKWKKVVEVGSSDFYGIPIVTRVGIETKLPKYKKGVILIVPKEVAMVYANTLREGFRTDIVAPTGVLFEDGNTIIATRWR